MQTILRATLLALPLLATIATSAHADYVPPTPPPSGFYIQPVINQSGVWDSNPLLAITGAKELYGSTTAPELIITDSTPTMQLSSDNKIAENIFNQSTFNSTDFHSKDSFTTQNQNWGLGLAGGVDSDTTRSSEVSLFGLNSLTPVRHLGYNVAPQISYNPTQIDKLNFAASLQESTYDKTTFTDYQIFSATPSYTHNFDPLNAGIFEFVAQQYQATKGPKNIIDTMGPAIGWNSNLTPRLSLNTTLGAQMTQQREAGFAPTAWKLDYNFSGDLTFKGQQDKIDAVATRAQSPFGNGTEALLTSFSASDTHAFNDLISVNANLSYEFADYEVSTGSNLNSLTGASGGVTYHFTNHLDLSGTYQYRYETLTNVSKGIDDHSVNLELVFHPQSWTL